MKFLSNFFIGLVAVLVFVIVTRILGYLAIKFDIVNVSDDTEPTGVGCAMWFIIAILVFLCWFVGYAINNFPV